jgi:hypothetical protein
MYALLIIVSDSLHEAFVIAIKINHMIRMSGLLIQKNMKADTLIITPHCVCYLSAEYYLNFKLHYAALKNYGSIPFSEKSRPSLHPMQHPIQE